MVRQNGFLDPGVSPIRIAKPFCTLGTAALLQALVPSVLPSQTVEGRLLEEGASAPIPSAFLVLLDLDGNEVAASLSDSTGKFQLRAPRAGSYSIRLERLGYRSSISPTLELSRDAVTPYDWTVPVEAIPLAAIRAVVESDRCIVRPARVEELVVAWDEARKALARVAWTEMQGRYEFQITRYKREYDFDSGQLVQQVQNAESGVHRTSPFVGRSPEELVEKGFARFDSDSIHYYGPDAAVLLSDAFLDTHCFRLGKSPPDHPDLIPLHFAPSGSGRGSDIRGTIWLGADDGRLDSVDFSFTDLPRWTDGREATGRVEFEELQNGAWIVRRWWLRGPTLGGLAPPEQGFRDVYSRGIPVPDTHVERGDRALETPTLLETGGDVVEYRPVGERIVLSPTRAPADETNPLVRERDDRETGPASRTEARTLSGNRPPARFPEVTYSLMDSVRALGPRRRAEWKDAARDRVDADPSDPLPHLELGYLYLDQGVERAAWDYFEHALEIDETFAPGYYALAVWALETGDSTSAIAHLERARQLDPSAVPVRYALGKALLGASDESERERGVDLLEEIALERPDHRNVLEDVARLLPPARLAAFASEVAARFPENERVLRFATSIGQIPDPAGAGMLSDAEARRAYGEAVTKLQTNDVEAGTSAYFRVLSQSPPPFLEFITKDVQEFFGEEHLERAVARRNGDPGRAILDLWMNDDPTPTTVANEVLAEFYKRLQEVRGRFGSPIGERGYDDRGRVWLRLGPPDERFEGPGPPRFHPNETWLYQRVSGQRLVLNFVSVTNGGFRLASTLSEAIPTWTRNEYEEVDSPQDLQVQPVMRDLEAFFLPRATMDPVYLQILHDLQARPRPIGRVIVVHESNILDNLSPYDGHRSNSSAATALSSIQVRLAEPGERLDVAVHSVSFEDGDRYTTWVLIGYPLTDLEPAIDSTGSYEYTIDKAATLFHDDGRVAFAQEARGTARTRERVESSDLITVDGVELNPAPGTYRLGVRVSDANSDKVGVYRYPMTLLAADRSTLRLSDIVLADRIETSDSESRFSRNGLRIVPSPTRTFRGSRPVWLYFEIYPPGSETGQDRAYEIEVRIRTSDRRVSLTRRIFGGLGRLLGREGESEITIAYGREFGPSAPSFETLSLDISELPAGSYELTITVSESEGDRTAVRTAEFAVVE